MMIKKEKFRKVVNWNIDDVTRLWGLMVFLVIIQTIIGILRPQYKLIALLPLPIAVIICGIALLLCSREVHWEKEADYHGK